MQAITEKELTILMSMICAAFPLKKQNVSDKFEGNDVLSFLILIVKPEICVSADNKCQSDMSVLKKIIYI